MAKGKWSRRTEGETFLDDAEKIIRPYVTKNQVLAFWRGPYPHKHFESTYEYETILVGMSDNPEQPPVIVLLKVWVETNSAYVTFTTGSDDDVSITGGIRPSMLQDIKEFAQRLSSVI